MVHRKKLETKTFLDIIIAYKNSKGVASGNSQIYFFLHFIVWWKNLNALIQSRLIWLQGHWKIAKYWAWLHLWENRGLRQAWAFPEAIGTGIRRAFEKNNQPHKPKPEACTHARTHTGGTTVVKYKTDFCRNNSYDS